MATILIVEDDTQLRNFLKELLTEYNYFVYTVGDAISALEFVKKTQPDMVLLDLGLPDASGETVCIEVKKKFPQVKVIILTAHNQSTDIVNGLNLGADDYVVKPFTAEVLLARIKARLRDKSADNTTETVTFGDLVLDKRNFTVSRGQKLINLTPKEFALMEYLITNPDRVLTREMILNRVWTYSPEIETRVVDIFISFLREKIDRGYKRKYIKSVRGFGYKFS